ncbi:restriction endonuclease subunit S [Thermoanaerobacterium thermosaccharolyticum]|uniref:restriction endonuclease subunit S n=1 Tax=Thermoanaerobacterium thermosaccharolyticum TaxID=1517 RepID=UPI003DAA3A03
MRYKRYDKYKDSGIDWIGEMPEHWKISKLKYLIYCLDGKRIPLSSEQRGEMKGDIPYWGANCIIDYVNDWIIDGEVVLLGEDGAPFFDRNKNVAFYSNEKIWPNNHVHILRVSQSINAKFLTYTLNTVDYRNYINGSTRDKLTQSEMKNIFIQLPSPQEQKSIVNFLDQKTAEIDGLIADKEKLIELLQEKRQAIISETVTKGLNPNVKMKDSGIEWIREIPEGWKITKIKYTTYVKGRIGWQGLRADEFIDEGPYLVTGTDFVNGKIFWENCYHISDDRYNEAPEIHLKEGDLLITKDGTIGKTAIVKNKPEKATLNSGIFVTRPLNQIYITKYMYWLLNSSIFNRYIDYVKTGSTINHLYQETFENFIYPLPEYDEQKAITDFLDQKTAEIDGLIADIHTQIQKLKEYRQSLISEAVTGKIKVC